MNSEKIKLIRHVILLVACIALLVEIPILVRRVSPRPVNWNTTVYRTSTGECYHKGNCGYLSRSKFAISLENASKKYDRCSVCNPPSLSSVKERPSRSEYVGIIVVTSATTIIFASSFAVLYPLQKKTEAEEERRKRVEKWAAEYRAMLEKEAEQRRRKEAAEKIKSDFFAKYGERSIFEIANVPDEYRGDCGTLKPFAVYATDSGKCYHVAGCIYSKYAHEVSLYSVFRKKYPCSLCCVNMPPQWVRDYFRIKEEAVRANTLKEITEGFQCS